MKRALLLLSILCVLNCKDKKNILENSNSDASSTSEYSISFENAAHHEAEVKVTFSGVQAKDFEVRMSRTSPGRYAIHEFAKNVYNFKATDSDGNVLNIERPDPYSWLISGHKGTVNVSYTLYANHGDGTYAQVDETHAHLNMPATFMYAPSFAKNPIEIKFNTREDLKWQVATQLKLVSENTFYAPDLQYFMDSPTEISDHMARKFEVDGQTIKFVLHHNGTEAEFDEYFEGVKKVVLQQKEVFGELPTYDYGTYTFLGCYTPTVTGDGMEHRNSTIVTSTRSLANGGMKRNMGTVSHEFFHCWNVERIRPASLEPFDFEAANMSGELWFAEGFTSYYDDLTMTRAGLMVDEDYIKGLTGSFNYVWNSPGRKFFNPIEMSYQAPFVDAARSVDDINRSNTFISYYSYGSMLGLALDLSLREQDLNLDNYMKLVWETYGKPFKNYTVKDLHKTLNAYAGNEFGDAFFNNYIYKSDMPNFERLFNTVGVNLKQNSEKSAIGLRLRNNEIVANTTIGSAAYNAGLEKGDKIITINGEAITDVTSLGKVVNKDTKPGDEFTIVYERFGNTKETKMKLNRDTSYTISSLPELSEVQIKNRKAWLGAK